MSAFIKAISYYLPPSKFTNSDYFNVFPEMAENKNLERVGVKERRIVDPHLAFWRWFVFCHYLKKMISNFV